MVTSNVFLSQLSKKVSILAFILSWKLLYWSKNCTIWSESTHKIVTNIIFCMWVVDNLALFVAFKTFFKPQNCHTMNHMKIFMVDFNGFLEYKSIFVIFVCRSAMLFHKIIPTRTGETVSNLFFSFIFYCVSNTCLLIVVVVPVLLKTWSEIIEWALLNNLNWYKIETARMFTERKSLNFAFLKLASAYSEIFWQHSWFSAQFFLSVRRERFWIERFMAGPWRMYYFHYRSIYICFLITVFPFLPFVALFFRWNWRSALYRLFQTRKLLHLQNSRIGFIESKCFMSEIIVLELKWKEKAHHSWF